MKILVSIVAVAMLVMLAACSTETTTPAASTEEPTVAKENSIVLIETAKGNIKVEVFEDKAPTTAANFLKLVNQGFYDGLGFHRITRLSPQGHKIVQGGDPDGDGTGGSDQSIPLEVSADVTHEVGSIAMARSQDPNSARSQFYFTLEKTPFLDGQYAVFGQVLEGLDVVDSLVVGDTMSKVSVQ